MWPSAHRSRDTLVALVDTDSAHDIQQELSAFNAGVICHQVPSTPRRQASTDLTSACCVAGRAKTQEGARRSKKELQLQKAQSGKSVVDAKVKADEDVGTVALQLQRDQHAHALAQEILRAGRVVAGTDRRAWNMAGVGRGGQGGPAVAGKRSGRQEGSRQRWAAGSIAAERRPGHHTRGMG
eukprot:CAMPEP_0181200974 /NCGR_PEP_ID=MMETSP1096-20121128/18060_1 /TAXON_ID=156174 ORGANISM="Chrysochromulina ericina, Strain CCMP281" /NCGR_SAMPLE_ID=MMETSP1096 /ASSEMBLY_ACC=CAM_ASM_000453 /LENGTH=181 /DNA_ID=CAMNT_0023291387 /DNA_START=206 /DNA_END=752 /DNA_ORIENTATION=+